MGQRGPSPKPTALRVLHGETRPSKINADEPQPAQMDPVAPDYLTDDGLKIWDATVYQLRAMGLLAAADQDALAVYCQSVVSYSEAARNVNQRGLLVKTADRGWVKNPAVQMMREFGAQVRSMAGEFGLTPAARVGLSTDTRRTDASGPERLLS